jgi:hypothetical protein
MSIRDLLFAMLSKEADPSRVTRPTTVRARPQLEGLETRMAPSGTDPTSQITDPTAATSGSGS